MAKLDLQKEESQQLKCGLIMPISAIDGCSTEHWEEVRIIIKEALKETDFEVDLVSDSNEIGIIQNRIVNNIYNSEIVICDVSGKNPNVMFELGMRLAFDKPTIIIKDEKTNYTFDTGQIEHIEYPRDLHYPSILEFKTVLKKKVEATYQASLNPEYTTFLKHFGEFKIAKVDQREVSTDQFLMEQIKELKQQVTYIAKNTSRVAIRDKFRSVDELKSRINSGLQGIPSIPNDKLNAIVEDTISMFLIANECIENDLHEHIVELIDKLADNIANETDLPLEIAFPLAKKEIDSRYPRFI